MYFVDFRFIVRLGCITILASLIAPCPQAQTVGWQGTVANPTLFDETRFGLMDDFSRAGVIGGIQDVNYIKRVLSPGDNIQSAINDGGPGVVYLNPGTYNIDRVLNLRKGVVLRGASRTGVILSVNMTATSKMFAVNFDSSTTYSGLENMTLQYNAESRPPIDREGLENGGWYGDAFQNNPYGNDELYVGLVSVHGDNNWLNQVSLIESGTDPVLIQGHHNTVRDSLIDRAYNKGGGGNGYFDIRGDNNLIAGNTIQRIRHFAIQQGAMNNVVFDNNIEGDVNFHNGDAGRNLVERNRIYKPSWHGWEVFGTGQPGVHAAPGPDNVIFKNTTWDYGWNVADRSPASDPNITYTFTGHGLPHSASWSYPQHGTYYAVREIAGPWSAGDVGFGAKPGFAIESNGRWALQVSGKDVWDEQDDFYFVWQELHGDGQITARILSQGNTNDWAKAGLMIREHLDAGSKHGMVALTPSNGVRFQFREETNSLSADMGHEEIGLEDGEVWVTLTREGNILSGYVYDQGDWVYVGSANIPMWEQAYVGFFGTSHDTQRFSEVIFDNVIVADVVSVPEPHSCFVMLMGLCSVLQRRRRIA